MTRAARAIVRSGLLSRFTLAIILLGWFAFLALCTSAIVRSWQSDPALHGLDADRFETLAVRQDVSVIAKNETLRVRYGKDIIGGEPLPRQKLDRAAGVVAEELELYPAELFRRVGLRHVVLCRDLTLSEQRVGGLPDFRRGLIFVSVDGLDFGESYFRTTVHHELFHLIDFRDDGKLDSDPLWEGLNPPKFRYKNVGRKALADPNFTSEPTDEVPGFLTTYSTSAVEEDKAEVFSFMMVHPDYVAERTDSDKALKAKVARMRALVKSFCPTIDERFWERVAKTRVHVELP